MLLSGKATSQLWADSRQVGCNYESVLLQDYLTLLTTSTKKLSLHYLSRRGHAYVDS